MSGIVYNTFPFIVVIELLIKNSIGMQPIVIENLAIIFYFGRATKNLSNLRFLRTHLEYDQLFYPIIIKFPSIVILKIQLIQRTTFYCVHCSTS